MSTARPTTVSDLLRFALQTGLIKDGKVVELGNYRKLEEFGGHVMRVGRMEDKARAEAFREEKQETKLGIKSGLLDAGQDDCVGPDWMTVEYERRWNTALGMMGSKDGSVETFPSCFHLLCKYMDVAVADHAYSVHDLEPSDLKVLRDNRTIMIGYTKYSEDNPRNHVVPLVLNSRTGTVDFHVLDGNTYDNCVHGVTSPQEFFNPGGRFYRTKFYANNSGSPEGLRGMEGTGFGGDAGSGPSGFNLSGSDPVRSGSGGQRPPPPESVVEHDARSGSANTTGGVVRPKRRVVAARGNYDLDVAAIKSYRVTGVTMFNNVSEMYLDTISRTLAQEIIEDLFDVWGVPKEQSQSVTYAEDLLWLFMIARTASNKADYNVIFEIPTKGGVVDADFSRFSVLLADKYGITRRNFARSVADDMRAYLNRPENQFVKSKSASRIYADPQYGGLSFDGSTGCSNMTSSEQKFTKLLEDRNLYERADLRADGASDTLMQGIHGGTRSIVAR